MACNSLEYLRIYYNNGGELTQYSVWNSTSTMDAWSVDAGDFDLDGDLDIAVGVYGNNTVFVNNFDAFPSTAAWTSTYYGDVKDILWADLDNDTYPELIVAGAGIAVYHNSNGTLPDTPAWSSSELIAFTGISAADYDGDGDLDIAASTESPIYPVEVYRNENGTLTSDPVWTSSEKEMSFDIAWADLECDGYPDLVVATGGPNRVYLNHNGVLSTVASWNSSEGDWSTSVAVADMNLDGYPDIAFSNTNTYPSTERNRIYINSNGLLPAEASWSSANSGNFRAAHWCDINLDGYPELIIGGESDPLLIYYNSFGTISASPSWTSGQSGDKVYGITCGDYNNDGWPEIFVANRGQSDFPYRSPHHRLFHRCYCRRDTLIAAVLPGT